MTALPLTVSRFATAFPTGPAYGIECCTTWGAFTALLRQRREGTKDGPNFVPARFNPEPDGRVRRLIANVAARTAIVLDCETDKETGEIPPPFKEAVARLKATGLGRRALHQPQPHGRGATVSDRAAAVGRDCRHAAGAGGDRR